MWNDWTGWPVIVRSIRTSEFVAENANQRQVLTAIWMAQESVGDKFAFPFALKMLALQGRTEDCSLILDVFHDRFTGKMIQGMQLC